ncbi:hypothetical protein IP92_01679 [Pseudoduganella flava]|uniref:PEP-CTERM sorting domain-containing protein n=1 Tax=Pseudoduganella flava TaxID=871742 RepID=A0A562PV16_9BURK|nr:hypothetical protein [Pseudoduganella flava]QGZ39417.1 hypothetical protein GO485_10395 [Pseudoduganella flava]TWI48291.1 hypothetical protein IP92_01679 [Pseudoduganella flava]
MPFSPRMLAVLLATTAGLLPHGGAAASHIELAGRLDSTVAEYADWRAPAMEADGIDALPETPAEAIFVFDTVALAAPWSSPAPAPYGIAVDAATPLPAAVPDAPQHDPAEPGTWGVLAVALLAVALAGRGKRGQGPFDPS